MTKTKKKIIIIAILIICIALIAFFAMDIGKPTITGYAVMTENSDLEMTAITYQEYEPLSLVGDFELPPTISTGDKIEVTYDGSIMETYPAKLGGVSKVKIIQEGDPSDVPDGILELFKEYGREVSEITEVYTMDISGYSSISSVKP
ncbi:MAG: hypothetical protein R3Y45_05415 [Bacillota bacterium]